MDRTSQFVVVALVVMAAGLYVVFSNFYGGDKQAILESFRVLSSKLGRWTIPLYIVVHAMTISLCLPHAILFEAGAAYLFGFLPGVSCVFAAKVLSASMSFWVGRALFRRSTAASDWVQSNKYFHMISEGVARDGWRFVLLARFSPVPSYIINYALAATNVRFFIDFLLPTLVGCLPMILQNASIGSLTSVATHTGGESTKSGLMSYIFPMVGLVSGVLISWRIKKYASNASVSLEPGAATLKDASNPSVAASEVSTKKSFAAERLFDKDMRQRKVTCAAG